MYFLLSCWLQSAAAAESRFSCCDDCYRTTRTFFSFLLKRLCPGAGHPRSQGQRSRPRLLATRPHLQMTAATVGNPALGSSTRLHSASRDSTLLASTYSYTSRTQDSSLLAALCTARLLRELQSARAKGAVDTHARRGNTARGQATGCLPPYPSSSSQLRQNTPRARGGDTAPSLPG